MNPEADLSIWYVNLYGSELKLLLLLLLLHSVHLVNPFYFAVVQFVLWLCHVFCSCAFSFADVLKLYIVGKGKLPLCIFFAIVQFVLQLCHVFCSCTFSFADMLKLCTIPTYKFADVQMK
jgi:hypothetical protein